MQDETSKHEEYSQKSWLGVGCVMILAKEISKKLVFWGAKIENILRNRGKGMENYYKKGLE